MYASQRLWVAYGIAVGFAVVTSAVGIRALIANGVSYSQDFSTVLRVARGASISEAVQPDDVDGKDPLPKYLKKSKIWLGPLNTHGMEKTTRSQSSDDSQSEGEDGEETTLSPTTVERTAGT